MKWLFFALAVIALAGCKKSELNGQLPDCVVMQIDKALSQPKNSALLKIDAYDYLDKTVYLYYSACCDQYNYVEDQDCAVLFSPSGGITGEGDLTHPHFFSQATYIKNIWIDPR